MTYIEIRHKKVQEHFYILPVLPSEKLDILTFSSPPPSKTQFQQYYNQITSTFFMLAPGIQGKGI